MKQLLEEVYKVTKWCECCKHTYLAEKKETQQPVGMRKLFEGIGKILAEQLIDIKMEPEYSQEAKDKLAEQIRQFNKRLAFDEKKLRIDTQLKKQQINKPVNNK